jgi:hypothetical protein
MLLCSNIEIGISGSALNAEHAAARLKVKGNKVKEGDKM